TPGPSGDDDAARPARVCTVIVRLAWPGYWHRQGIGSCSVTPDTVRAQSARSHASHSHWSTQRHASGDRPPRVLPHLRSHAPAELSLFRAFGRPGWRPQCHPFALALGNTLRAAIVAVAE